MDPLKRSASKLKPPSTFARTNSSSELSTVMALAAAYNKTDNTLTSAHGSAGSAALATPTPHAIADRHLLTLEMLDVPAKPISGMKRKAEEISRDRRPQPQPARPQALAPRGIANTRRNVASTTPSTLVSKTPQLSSNVGKPIRPPPRQPSAVTTAPRSGPVTVSSRPSPATAPRGNTSRPVAAPTKGNSRAPMPVARKGPMPASTLPGSKTVGGPGNKANESKEKEVQDLAAESPMSSTELLSALEFPKKKKRAAWDTKNRLQDMEEITGALHGLLSKSVNSMNGMTNKLELNESKIMELENFRENLEGKVADKESEYHVICQKMSVAQSDLQVTARKNADEIQSLRTQLSLEKEHMHLLEAQIQQGLDGTNSKLRLATAQLDHQMEENAALRGTISTQSSLRLAFESDNRVLKMKIEQTEGTLASREKALGSLEHELVDTEAIVMDLEQKIRGDEAVRRKLYHSIMDLKGNVRVYARVRPLTPEISMSTPITTFIFPDQEGHELEITSPLPSRLGSSILGISRIRGLQLPATTSTGVSKKTYPFKFDKVFGPQSAQQDIYEEIQPLVQSALDGANTCVFMYGQKGSGKTHTLVGSEGKYDAEAVLPQAILELLQATKDLEAKSGCSTTVEARFFRIHDQGLGGDVETIHDMLASPGRASIEPSEAIEIGIGQNGKAEITGATVMRLSSIRDSEALLKAATTPCSGSSDMKEGAQRQCRNCHSIYSFRIIRNNLAADEIAEGSLWLIDLGSSSQAPSVSSSNAGSVGSGAGLGLPRPSTLSSAHGPDQNKGLTALKDVLTTIARKDTPVPYRASKLTHALQPVLGRHSPCKVLFLITLSPLESDFEETLASLRFGTLVNACVIMSSAATGPSSVTGASSASKRLLNHLGSQNQLNGAWSSSANSSNYSNGGG